MMDDSVFSRMENDELALGCMVLDENAGQLMYSSQDWISLADFVSLCPFARDDGLLFVLQLLEKALSVSRNKPVVFGMDTIFVSPYGDDFRFICLPLGLEHWLFACDECRSWILELTKSLQLKDSYELCGFLFQALHKPDFSLSSLVSALQSFKEQRQPKGWLKRFFVKQQFCLKEPLNSRYCPVQSGDDCFESAFLEGLDSVDSSASFSSLEQDLESLELEDVSNPYQDLDPDSSLSLQTPLDAYCSAPVSMSVAENPSPSLDWAARSFQNPQGKNPFAAESSSACRQASQFLDLQKTQVLFEPEQACAFLEIAGVRYELSFESIRIGRHMTNDIVLNDPSVSSFHARIIRDPSGWYLQDAGSTNGTFASLKPLLREAKLENGMKVGFGKVEGTFYE